MAAEMGEQPAVLAALAEHRARLTEGVRAIVPEPLAGIVLVARGSSDHAAVFGRYVLELASGRPVSLAAPSLHTLYRSRADHRGYLAVGVSQSGRTPEITTVLERVREMGARTVAITNDPTSPLALAGEVVIELGAGDERAVPATKTFTAQVAAFAMLAGALGSVPWPERDWDAVPDAVASVLEDGNAPARVAAELGSAGGLLAVARGFLYVVALEAALKIKETTGVLAQGYSVADLRHGPIGVIESGFPVLAFTTSGPAARDTEELVRLLRRREARVFLAGDHVGADLPVPNGLAEALMFLPMSVRVQQVAHAMALARGIDPDTPPGLSKVTPTE
jgi:glucosamine--fructose-6-phosphate aminotransferase (isomerizing)